MKRTILLLILTVVSGACVDGTTSSNVESTVGSTSTTATAVAAPSPTTTDPPPDTPPTTREPANPPTEDPSGPDCSNIGMPGAPSFFAWCPAASFVPVAIYRDAWSDDVTAALTSLARGTTEDEQAQGYMVGFDVIDDGAEIMVETQIDGDGVLTFDIHVDGESWDPGNAASTSAQLFSFVNPLYATVFHFSEVQAIDMTTHCWGEMGCDQIVSRAEWESTLFLNGEVLIGAGCSLAMYGNNSTLCTIDSREPIGAASVDVEPGDRLNVRANPSAEGAFITSLSPGTVVKRLEAVEVANDGGTWRLINVRDTTGWVNEAFLSWDKSEAEILIEAFIQLSRSPSAATLTQVPFADTVDLGLADFVWETRRRSELANPDMWIVDWDGYLVDVRWAPVSYRVHTEPYKFCVGEEYPPLPGYEDHRVVSAHTSPLVFKSCLAFSSIDLYINESGEVEAVRYNQWEW